jgi:diguanylate cyclase (GGDEF)-like protein
VRAAHHAAVRLTRAGDASLSRTGGPLRRDGRLTRVLPFGVIATVSLILTLLPTGAADAESAHPDAAIVAGALFASTMVSAVLFPWDRWPSWTQFLVPLAYLCTVMLVVHAQGADGAGYTILYLLPVAWLALYGPMGQLLTALALTTGLILLPPWLDQMVLGENHYSTGSYVLTVVVLLIIVFVAAALRLATDAASRDVLTGLPNRRVFMAALRRRAGSGAGAHGPVAVAIIDLDHFKAFNDAHGHDAGDRLLEATAEAWAGAIRDRDLLARIGGEEFGLIVEGGVDDARAVAERLIAIVPEQQTASAGVAACPPDGDPQVALKAADDALYSAKDAGRARVVTAAR